MKKKDFLNARNAYAIAKAAYEVAKEDYDNAELELMARHGYEGKFIWTADIDDTTFEKLCEEYEKEHAREISALRAAETALHEAEKAFAETAIVDIPLPAEELESFKQKVKTNAAIRAKVIDLAMKLDVRTIPV